MGKREVKYWNLPVIRTGVFIVLSGAFLIGGVAGCLFARLADGTGADELGSYLTEYLRILQAEEIELSFWSVLWLHGQYFLAAVLLGLTAIGAVGFPLLFGIKGFLFAFSIAGCYRAFGVFGLGIAAALFGIPAILWLPGLFLLGVQGCVSSLTLARRGNLDTGSPLFYNMIDWKQAAYAVIFLLAGAVMEYCVVPMAFRAMTQML